jgi:hypothetical protein
MLAVPVWLPAMTPVVPTEATVGLDVLQVIGGLVRVKPTESVTVALMVCAGLPFKNVSAFPPAAVARVMDVIGQVTKVTGALVALPALAKKEVCPGVLAVARAWLKRRPLPLVVSVTTVLFRAPQVIGPMVEVMSLPLLVATTW